MRRPAALHLTVVLLAALPLRALPLNALPPHALPQGRPAADVPPVPPTRLGLQVLAQAPIVVVGRVISVRDAGLGSDLLHVRVLERMLGGGCQRDDELAVLTGNEQFLFGSEDLLFLKPYRTAGRFEIVQRINSADPHYAAKLSLARRTIWLLEIRDVQQRVDATLDMLLSMLVSRDAWVRGHALDELQWMAREQSWVFSAERRARLTAAARSSADPAVRSGVEKVASLLTSQDQRVLAAPPKEQSRP